MQITHIGVIKYLEENKIEINKISFNSMGVIIGALLLYKKQVNKG